MSTSIHAHVEVKKNNKWLHFAAPDITRDYDLFDIIAGIRPDSGIAPVVPARGLPVAAIMVPRNRTRELKNSVNMVK